MKDERDVNIDPVGETDLLDPRDEHGSEQPDPAAVCRIDGREEEPGLG